MNVKQHTFLIAVLLLILCSCGTSNAPTPDGETETNDSLITILDCELLNSYLHFQAQEIVAKRYGLLFSPVAGCNLNSRLKDSIAQLNKKIESRLAKHGGFKNVEAIYVNINETHNYLLKAEQIILKDSLIKREIPFINETMLYFTNNANTYWIKVIQLKSTFSGALHDTTHLIKMDTSSHRIITIEALKKI